MRFIITFAVIIFVTILFSFPFFHGFLSQDDESTPSTISMLFGDPLETPILNGSYVYNAGECSDELLIDTVFEVNFSPEIDVIGAGIVLTSSAHFSIQKAGPNQQAVLQANKLIENCTSTNVPDDVPYIAHYSPYPRKLSFVYYRDIDTVVQISEDETLILKSLSRFRGLKARHLSQLRDK